MRIRLLFLAVTIPALSPIAAQAQFTNFSGSLGLNVPIGEMDKEAQPGFGIAIHTGFSNPSAVWTARSSFTFDRFSAKSGTGVDYFQYLGLFGGDIVHNTNSRTYQYLGVAYYQFKKAFTPVASPGGGPTVGSGGPSQNEGTPGFQGGVGLNFGKTTRTYVEIGIVDVLTSGKSSVWFPLRFGIRL